MLPSTCLIGAIFHLAALITAVNSHNITQILSNYGDFSQFNEELSQTEIAGEINRRQMITVLAVDNAGTSQLTSQPVETEKKILSLHVVLDYYDEKKLQSMKDESVLLTTMFQASGKANSQLGFLNVTRSGSDQIMFGSASPGSLPVASLVRSVYSEPFNISILQISSVISPAGLSNGSAEEAAAPGGSVAPSPSIDTIDFGSSPTPSAMGPIAAYWGPAPAEVGDGGGAAKSSSPGRASTRGLGISEAGVLLVAFFLSRYNQTAWNIQAVAH